MTKTKSILDSQNRKKDVWAHILGCAVTGQVICYGLSKVPWMGWVKVSTRDILPLVNDAVEAFLNKWERE